MSAGRWQEDFADARKAVRFVLYLAHGWNGPHVHDYMVLSLEDLEEG